MLTRDLQRRGGSCARALYLDVKGEAADGVRANASGMLARASVRSQSPEALR
jgi:hypothetical protein